MRVPGMLRGFGECMGWFQGGFRGSSMGRSEDGSGDAWGGCQFWDVSSKEFTQMFSCCGGYHLI